MTRGPILSTIIVLIVSVAIGSAVGKWAGQSTTDALLSSEEQIREVLLNNTETDIFKMIDEHAPKEFDNIVRRLNDVVKNSQNIEEIFFKSMKITQKLPKKYASHARTAPDALNKKVIKENISTTKYLFNNGKKCNQFIVHGTEAVLADEAKNLHKEMSVLMESFEKQAVALLRALLTGAKSGREPKVATHGDWEIVGANWHDAGATDNDVASVSSPSVDDPNLCPAMISLLETVVSAEGSAAQRVRAELVAEIAGG